MRAVWQSFVDFFTSSKLTVWLLVLSMALVFLATLDQRTLGVLGIQQKWFHTFIVIHFVGGFPVPVFPGGCTIGALLFLNLAAAFVCRFTFAWKNCGVWLTHAGLVLLLAGGFLNGFMQEDYQMRLREGETKNYSESFHRYELAIIDATPAAHDNAAASAVPAAHAAHDNAAAFAVSAAHDNAITIPENILARAKPAAPFDLRDGGDGGADGGGALPFRVTIRAYYRNAVLVRPGSDPRFASLPTATDGIGRRVLAVPVSPTWRQNESNQPAVYVEISAPQNTALAPLPPQPSLPLQPPQPSLPSQPPQPPQTWLLSSQLGEPQIFDCAGRHWRMELRPARRHTDFSLTLLKVTHDVYAGSSIPKNYASLVLLRAPGDPAGREVRIHMNAPLRHGGLAFYQYQMRAEAGESVLQVVSNPGWLIPYIACALMGLGLIVQFSISLIHFGKRSSATPAGAVCYSEMAAAPPRSSALQRAQEVAKKTKHLPNIFLRALPKIFPSILSKIFPKILPNILPLAALFAATLWLAASSRPGKNATPFDIAGFSRLHVKADGRGKPLDTVARATLLRLQGRQNVRNAAGRALEPAEWLLDAAFRPEVAADYRVFEITQPELLALAHLTTADGDGGKRFSFAQLQHALDAITAKARQAGARIPADRDGFDRAVLVLHGNLAAYRNLEYSLAPPAGALAAAPLGAFVAPPAGAFVAPPAGAPGGALASDTLHMMAQFGSLLAIPPAASAAPVASATSAASTASATPATPAASVTLAASAASGASAAPVAPDGEWRKPGEVLLTDAQNKTVTPAALAYIGLAHTWRAQKAGEFNEIIRLFHADLAKRFPDAMSKASIETAFNHAGLFYHSSILFVIVFLCSAVSWLRWPAVLRRAALWLMALAWLVTTAGILTRMWLGGYPPVTNLYSSALGVAWFAVTLCLVLEIVFRNATGSMAGGIIGFCALLIAHHLSLSGDTLEMMQAVLDSNFWLATHVVTITFGYAAMFLAGILATIGIFLRAFTRAPTRETTAAITRMVYGIVCFATLFSFAGTVLGGIWADQSWGRFWGWDPKENGALIIVIWNAVFLHARRGGLVKARGLMAMAVFGNIVTAWSWFGTNLLEVGLHSYGFTSGGAIALAAFVAAMLLVIALAFLPQKGRAVS